MAKIINLQEVKNIADKIRQSKKSIVLAGGCFDIVHVGHIKFLQEAKKKGGCLFVLLESDENVRRLKGNNRPIFTQKERAQVLSSLQYIDYVLLMPPMTSDKEYEDLVSQIKPDEIAVTANDPILTKKQKNADMLGGKLKIIPYLKTHSSSKLAQLLGVE